MRVIKDSGASAPSTTTDSRTAIEKCRARSANAWGRTQTTCVISLISTTVHNLTERAVSYQDVNSANPIKS